MVSNMNQSSIEGFVAKEDMPLALQLLFRARRPLDPLRQLFKPAYKTRPIEPLVDQFHANQEQLAHQSAKTKLGEDNNKMVDHVSSEEEGAIKPQDSIFGHVSKDVGEAWLRQIFEKTSTQQKKPNLLEDNKNNNVVMSSLLGGKKRTHGEMVKLEEQDDMIKRETSNIAVAVGNETKFERRKRVKKSKIRDHLMGQKQDQKKYDPFKDTNIQNTDPDCTVFIGRLNYQTTEEKLKKEMELFGPIALLRIVRKPDGNSRGYAFCTYKRFDDANYAAKNADGRRVDCRYILVDREFGRTKKDWFPMRLGGGRGGESRKYMTRSGAAAPAVEASLSGSVLIKEVKDEIRIEREKERDLEREQRLKKDFQREKEREREPQSIQKTTSQDNNKDVFAQNKQSVVSAAAGQVKSIGAEDVHGVSANNGAPGLMKAKQLQGEDEREPGEL